MGKAAVVAAGSPAVEKVAVVEEAAGVVVVEVVEVVRVAVAVLVVIPVVIPVVVPLPRVEAGDAVDRVKRMAKAIPLKATPPRARAAKVKVRAHRSPRAKAEVDRTTSLRGIAGCRGMSPVIALQFREPMAVARYPSRDSQSSPRRCDLNE